MGTMKFQIFKLNLEKAEEPEIKFPTSVGSSNKQEHSTKISTSALFTTSKPLTVWMATNWKILKHGKFLLPDHLTCLLRNLFVGQEAIVRTLHETTKLQKEYDKTVYCHFAYLSYVQCTSCKMLGQINHKLESRLL